MELVNRRTMLKQALLTASSASLLGILAACGDNAVPTSTVAPTGTTAISPSIASASTVSSNTPSASPSATVGGNAASAPSTATTGSRTSIDFWVGLGAASTGVMQGIVKRFNDANPRVTVQLKSYGDYKPLTEALQAAVAAKKPPALAGIGFDYLTYLAQNIPHLTIDDAAKRDTGATTFLTDTFTPDILNLGKVDGVQHILPLLIGGIYLYYNADLFKRAGLDRAPATWDEARDYARQLTAKTGTTGIVLYAGADFWTGQALVESNGGKVLIGAGKDARTGVDSPEAAAAMQLWADLILKDKSSVNLPDTQAEQSFPAGQVAMMVSYGSIAAAAQKMGNFAVGSGVLPTFGTRRRQVPLAGNGFFVTATDPAQQTAGWEFMKFFYTPEVQAEFTKGTGYPPVRKGLADDPQYLKSFYDQNAVARTEILELPDAVPWVSWPGKNGLQAAQELIDARGRILSGNQDAATAMGTAAMRINQLIRE